MKSSEAVVTGKPSSLEPVDQAGEVIAMLAPGHRSPGRSEGRGVLGDEGSQGQGGEGIGEGPTPGKGRYRTGLDSLVHLRYHDAILRQSHASSNHSRSQIEPGRIANDPKRRGVPRRPARHTGPIRSLDAGSFAPPWAAILAMSPHSWIRLVRHERARPRQTCSRPRMPPASPLSSCSRALWGIDPARLAGELAGLGDSAAADAPIAPTQRRRAGSRGGLRRAPRSLVGPGVAGMLRGLGPARRHVRGSSRLQRSP